MAANDYYRQRDDGRSDTPLQQAQQASYTSYNHHDSPSPTLHITSPVSSRDDYSYNPYAQSRTSIQSPYFGSAAVGGRDHEQNPYADDVPLRQHPSKQSSEIVMTNHLADDPTIIDRPPLGKEKRRRKKGWFSGRIPWVVYTLTTIQVIVFIAELGKYGALTGTPIMLKPQVNPMLGPSPYLLVNMGARYVPCMRATDQGMNSSISWPCPNSQSNVVGSPDNSCKLNEQCGFGAGAFTTESPPGQWYRFILPIFLHAGFIHIGFNMLLQILLGGDMEKEIGSIRFTLVYLSSGIFGFVLGGNFAPEGIVSTGASGSLFGVIAILLLDLLYHWGERKSPWVELGWIMVDITISLALGLLPGLDNFSHIGGFLMGLVLGICLLHTPDILRRRVGADLPPYTSVRRSRMAMDTGGIKGFVKSPVAFFKGRKPLWWAWWLIRAAALIGVLVGFIVLLQNFYKSNPAKCSWCRYLTCLPIKNWCDIGKLDTQTAPEKQENRTSPTKRAFLELALPVLIDALQ